MSNPQQSSVPKAQQAFSQQLTQQYQNNQAQRYPYYNQRNHYLPPSGSQQPGPTAAFLQAGMGVRSNTSYQSGSSSAAPYQYPSYPSAGSRTATPSNAPAGGAASTSTPTGTTGTGTGTTTQGSTSTPNNPNLPPHLQQYAHYFQNIQNLQNHFPGYNSGNYNYTPSATYGQTTTGTHYNSAYPGTYGTGGTSRPYGAPRPRDEDDDLMPGMDDADYSAQSQYQSQSKADLKVLLDNFTPEQHARFEAYRRSALNKNSVKKVVQTTTGQLVSAPVAQVLAGVAKVFVGEIVEKARAIQERQGDTGPLTPEHLRKAYRAYQEECGMVGPARRVKGRKLFVR